MVFFYRLLELNGDIEFIPVLSLTLVKAFKFVTGTSIAVITTHNNSS